MIEVLKQAYQLLLTEPHAPTVCDQIEVILRQAIAELESQEPVAVWELFEDGWDSIADPEWMESLPIGTKLYTHPPQRKPLTDEQIVLIVGECAASHQHTDIHFARAIEAAHGIKE